MFVAISRLLRNLWVWIHATYLKEGVGESATLRLELLRFKRLLEWINLAVIAALYDGTEPYVDEFG